MSKHILKDKRTDEVLYILAQRKFVSVHELSAILYSSESTVRRVLASMEESGQIVRKHGGAELANSTADTPLSWEHRINGNAESREARMRRSANAVSLIMDGDVIMLDSSATVYHMTPLLRAKRDIIVITNSLETARAVSQLSIKTFMVGGLIQNSCIATIGDEASRMLGHFTSDIAFVSCSGLADDGKVTERSMEENIIRLAMLENSKRSVLLADKNRYHISHMHTLCRIYDFDEICTDAPLPDNLKQLRKEYGKHAEII